jgi:hypothetical protein
MKKILFRILCISIIISLASCSGMVDKAKEKAKKMVEEQIEKAEAEKAKTEAEAAEATQETANTESAKAEEKKEIEWWQKNFSMSFTYTIATAKCEITIIRYGDAARIITNMAGNVVDAIYKPEDDKTARYIFNTSNKKALRSEGDKTVDQHVKGTLSEYAIIPKTDPRKQKDNELQGTEELIGRTCEKWVKESNILGNISRGTVMIDKELGFIMKTDLYVKMKDKETNTNVVAVTAFSLNPKAADVQIDLSGYEIQKQ